MKTITLVVSTLALVSLLAVSAVTADDTAPAATTVAPAVPETPAAVEEVVYARKFQLENGYTYDWCKERPTVTSGYLLVLKVDPDLVYPRQSKEPVLYVGNMPAQRLNVGYKSGYVVAIAPVDTELDKVTIWFGTPELPENVDANVARAQADIAKNVGIKAFSAKALKSALERGKEQLNVASDVDVLRVAAELIRQYAPDEANLADDIVPAPKPVPVQKGDDD